MHFEYMHTIGIYIYILYIYTCDFLFIDTYVYTHILTLHIYSK
jgi:hypothetical protein